MVYNSLESYHVSHRNESRFRTESDRPMKTGHRHFRAWAALSAVVVILAGALWWHIVLNPRFSAVVDHRIYRSARLSPSRLEAVIRKYGIRTIIALVGPENGALWYENEKAVAERCHAQLINIAFASLELPQYNALNQLVDALQTAPSPILLHCYRGSDRSGMASAIALILYENASLETAEKQFSWRFGIVPYSGSIGVQLFGQYRNWLLATGRVHSREVCLDWVRNHYVDPKGNIDYDIDSINGVGFTDSKWGDLRIATVQKGAGRYTIRGWGVDYRRLSPADTLRVGIGHTFRQVVFTAPRPNLPAFLGLTGKLNPDLNFGWECQFDDADLSPGCHDIRLAVGSPGGIVRVIGTRIRLCVEAAGGK